MIAIDDTDRVSPRHACPDCGQDDSNLLVWQEDEETVRCETCGRIYVPGEE